MRRVVVIGALVSAVLAGGCGGKTAGDDGADRGGSAGSTSGIPAERRLTELSTAELGLFCDWVAELNGGYGQEHVCSATDTASTPANREECLSDFDLPPGCNPTVRQTETCFLLLEGALCDALALLDAAECEPLQPCLVVSPDFD